MSPSSFSQVTLEMLWASDPQPHPVLVVCVNDVRAISEICGVKIDTTTCFASHPYFCLIKTNRGTIMQILWICSTDKYTHNLASEMSEILLLSPSELRYHPAGHCFFLSVFLMLHTVKTIAMIQVYDFFVGIPTTKQREKKRGTTVGFTCSHNM